MLVTINLSSLNSLIAVVKIAKATGSPWEHESSTQMSSSLRIPTCPNGKAERKVAACNLAVVIEVM
jgi:hypothetical protein